MSEVETPEVLKRYSDFVGRRFPNRVHKWPLISTFGHTVLCGQVRNVLVFMYRDTGSGTRFHEGVGNIPIGVIGTDHIDEANKESVRAKLITRYGLGPRDVVFFEGPSIVLDDESEKALRRHQMAIGMSPDKIFLSHKGADKVLVRDFKETLQLLGFSPWLDEDAMHAGEQRSRAILKGFEESCAAVFFVTPNFRDETYLAEEINYAIDQKRSKGDAFRIITLVLEVDGKRGEVPPLLQPYIWKNPRTPLEGLREILHALPITVGEVHWR